MRYLSVLIAFVSGAGLGVAGTRLYFKNKYETLADEEIASMKEFYTEKKEIKEKKQTMMVSASDRKAYEDAVRRTNYNSLAKMPEKEESDLYPREDLPEAPYEITEEEFEDFDPYFEKIIYTYYDIDGILTDDQDNIVDDMDETLGKENIAKFFNGDSSTIYIRNPKLSADYEIDRIDASYKTITGGDF